MVMAPDPQDNNQHSYLYSWEVFDADLAQELYLWLGKAQRVTFAPTDRPYNKSERLLDEKLVDRAREALDRQDILTGRIVFVGPDTKAHRLPGDARRHAEALAAKGFSILVIADVLGYSDQTLRRWNIKSAKESGRQAFIPNGTETELDLWREIGRARVLELRPDDDRGPRSKHYLLVGAAMVWLQQLV